jgi:hypothetical protein
MMPSAKSWIKRNRILILFYIMTIFSRFPATDGEDIVNARANWQTGAKTDFWGGMSTLIYGHFPSFIFNWQTWIVFIQVTLTLIALTYFQSKSTREFNIRCLSFYLVSYCALVFSSQSTRDGLMFSLVLFAVSLFLLAIAEGTCNKYQSVVGLIILIFGLSLRPWVSIAALPFLLYVNSKLVSSRRRWFGALMAILVITGPITLEVLSASAQHLNKSYPEQQVMIMDYAASYCWTNNPATHLRARNGLQQFSSDPLYPDSVCQLFRADTWLSLVKSHNESAKNMTSDFSLIQPGDYIKYMTARNGWLEMIIRDPVTYLQNRMQFATKLLIGSDSRNIRFLSAKGFNERLKNVYFIPYDGFVSLHLFSLIAIFSYITFVALFRKFKHRVTYLILTGPELLIIATLGLWMLFSSIAYIGSNGRYTYTATLASLVIWSGINLSTRSSESID